MSLNTIHRGVGIFCATVEYLSQPPSGLLPLATNICLMHIKTILIKLNVRTTPLNPSSTLITPTILGYYLNGYN